jgi:lipopolysaccharide export system protein LptA
MKNVTRLTIILFLLAISSASFSQSGDNQKWIKIAGKTVSFKSDKDEVTPSGKERKVDKIKVKCTQGTLTLKKVRVKMSDGEEKEYDAKGIGVLSKGMSSFAFDLPGKDNTLQKIELEYETVGVMMVTKKAKIEILGHVID